MWARREEEKTRVDQSYIRTQRITFHKTNKEMENLKEFEECEANVDKALGENVTLLKTNTKVNKEVEKPKKRNPKNVNTIVLMNADTQQPMTARAGEGAGRC